MGRPWLWGDHVSGDWAENNPASSDVNELTMIMTTVQGGCIVIRVSGNILYTLCDGLAGS